MTRVTSRIVVVLVLAAMSLTWSGRPSDAAGSWSLFVRRAWVPSTQHGGKIFAPADALLKALGYSWTEDGGNVTATPGSGGGPVLRSRMLTLILEGKAISPETIYYKGKSWVAVRPVAEAAGGLYIESPSAGMVQVVFTNRHISPADIRRAVRQAQVAPPVETKPAVKPEGKEGGEKASASTEEKGAVAEESGKSDQEDTRKHPLKTSADISNPALPGANYPAEVRGSYSVKNVADLPVKNVHIQVVIVDQTEQAVAQGTLEPRFVSEIGPGQSVTGDIHWWNYQNLLNVTPKVKVTFDPLPEKKKEPKDEHKAQGVPGSDTGTKPAGGK